MQLHKNCGAILSRLEAAAVDHPWPGQIAELLSQNLTILDPENSRENLDLASLREALVEMGDAVNSVEDAIKKQELRSQVRRIAEVQTCIRLIIMNTVMTYVWTGASRKWQRVVPDVIDCLRLVMQQPALAEAQLTEIEQRLNAPEETEPPARLASPALDSDAAAE